MRCVWPFLAFPAAARSAATRSDAPVLPPSRGRVTVRELYRFATAQVEPKQLYFAVCRAVVDQVFGILGECWNEVVAVILIFKSSPI